MGFCYLNFRLYPGFNFLTFQCDYITFHKSLSNFRAKSHSTSYSSCLFLIVSWILFIISFYSIYYLPPLSLNFPSTWDQLYFMAFYAPVHIKAVKEWWLTLYFKSALWRDPSFLHRHKMLNCFWRRVTLLMWSSCSLTKSYTWCHI